MKTGGWTKFSHFETMIETSFCWYLQGHRISSGFLGGAEFRPPTVGVGAPPKVITPH